MSHALGNHGLCLVIDKLRDDNKNKYSTCPFVLDSSSIAPDTPAMELRSSRRSIRSSHLTAQQRAFPPTVTAYVSSRLSSSGTGPFALRSAKKSQSERAHSNSNEIRVYHLRSGQLPAESKRRTSTSRLGHSQSAPSKLGLASSRLPSAIRDDPSYRGNIVFSSSMTRECSICIESKGMYVLSHSSCLPPTDDRIETPISSPRLPPQVWSYHVHLQILRRSS